MQKPIVIICPGGAYRHLSPRESEPVARAFEENGIPAEILTYTICDETHSAPLGLIPLRELAGKVQAVRNEHLDAPILVCGFSAGGHLAASLGVHWKTLGLPRPDGLILSYPVITATPGLANEESFENLAGDDRAFFSLENHVTSDVPPSFLWHTAADQDVPVENSLLFAEALSRHHVPFEMHIFPNGVHGLSLATPEVDQPEKERQADPHVATWFDECIQWIHDTFLQND